MSRLQFKSDIKMHLKLSVNWSSISQKLFLELDMMPCYFLITQDAFVCQVQTEAVNMITISLQVLTLKNWKSKYKYHENARILSSCDCTLCPYAGGPRAEEMEVLLATTAC